MKKKSQSKVIEDKPSMSPKSLTLHLFEAVTASVAIVLSFILIAYSMCFFRFLIRQLFKLFSLGLFGFF